MFAMLRRAALLGALALTVNGFAQSATAAKTQSPKSVDPAAVTFSADHLISTLGLSEEQAEKLRSIEEEYNARFSRMEELTDLEERDRKQLDLTYERNRMVASVLTQEQALTMKEMQRAMVKEHEEKIRMQR